MDNHLVNNLIELSNVDGVAGREQAVSSFISEKLAETSHQIEIDTYGNLYCRTENNHTNEILLVAHMDEVGFLVKHITDKGFIYIEPLGSWANTVLVGQTVRVTARKTQEHYIGVFGTTFANGEIPSLKHLYIDMGVSSKQEVFALGIQIGDMVTPYTEAQLIGNGKTNILGKAWDDRAQCAALLETMLELSTRKLKNVSVTGAFSVQEEVGTRGAKVIREHTTPTFAIILDVATAKDTPSADFYENRALGKGPGIVFYDKTAVSSIELADFVTTIAQEQEIPFQYDMLSGGGTDAGAIQYGAGHIPTLVLSLGIRYCHSNHSIVNIADVQNTVKLLLAVITALDEGDGNYA